MTGVLIGRKEQRQKHTSVTSERLGEGKVGWGNRPVMTEAETEVP